jgi:hypothetical protein
LIDGGFSDGFVAILLERRLCGEAPNGAHGIA